MIGIIAGTIGAIDALLSMGGTHPFWSLAIFFLCVWIVYGVVVFGADERARSLSEASREPGRWPGSRVPQSR